MLSQRLHLCLYRDTSLLDTRSVGVGNEIYRQGHEALKALHLVLAHKFHLAIKLPPVIGSRPVHGIEKQRWHGPDTSLHRCKIRDTLMPHDWNGPLAACCVQTSVDTIVTEPAGRHGLGAALQLGLSPVMKTMCLCPM